MFPETFPSRDHIDWLPVDKLSKILVEILSSASKSSNGQTHLDEKRPDKSPNPSPPSDAPHTKTYHVTNPTSTSWSASFAALVLAAYPKNTVRPVPFADWLRKLKTTELDENVDIERNPAIRLVEFYENAANADKGQRVLPTDAATETSQTLRNLGPLQRGWVEGWMRQWGLKVG